MGISRRLFIQSGVSAAGAAIWGVAAPARAEEEYAVSNQGDVSGAVVICNHWTQYGIGETFPEGEIRGRWYRRNFSTVFGLEQGRRWLELSPQNRVCHEFDAYFLEALATEDAEYLGIIRNLIDRRVMELPGGTFGQAESQVFGYESALRQLTFGQATYQHHLGRSVDTFIVEEQNFFPQLPQLLKLAGFKYASIQFQNSGTPDVLPDDIILWEAPDGTSIPTIPNHPGLLSCARQWKSYDEVLAQLAGRGAPLVFQWIELWPPGLDWGASIAPYAEAIDALEAKGFRQMLLTEYIEWALKRCKARRVRIPLDRSNYNNNFFQGGWGYENEKTTRGANRCESLLLAAETLCAGASARHIVRQLGNRLRELWSRVLVSQNHDPYLAGSVPAYIDGLRSFQSELAVKQLAAVLQNLREEGHIDTPLSPTEESFRIFNPCPWQATSPILLELDKTVWPSHGFQLAHDTSEESLAAVFRSDNGNVLVGPAIVKMAPFETRDLCLRPVSDKSEQPRTSSPRLTPKREGHVWETAQDGFAGVEFEPLVGEWRQIPSYFDSMHPNINVEAAYTRIEEAPVALTLRRTSDDMDVAVWREDLMRIREVEEPALSVQGLVFAGETATPFVQFNHRLTSTIRFNTGTRPSGTWRFRIRVAATGPKIFADSPFSEEERREDAFYCARYIRIEWPERHILWCPSQNTLFRHVEDPAATIIECTVFDFSFTGTANWDMRFHAACSFSTADSMRLAEMFHRRPIRIPTTATAGRVAGIAADNPNVLITHVFPAGRGATAVRMLNASHEMQQAVVTLPGRFANVAVADLGGNGFQGAAYLPTDSNHQWHYEFRPWEIATFRMKWA